MQNILSNPYLICFSGGSAPFAFIIFSALCHSPIMLHLSNKRSINMIYKYLALAALLRRMVSLGTLLFGKRGFFTIILSRISNL